MIRRGLTLADQWEDAHPKTSWAAWVAVSFAGIMAVMDQVGLLR